MENSNINLYKTILTQQTEINSYKNDWFTVAIVFTTGIYSIDGEVSE